MKDLGFTDGGLEMVTADIVEFDSVIVDIVEDGKTEFISLTIVRLGNSTTKDKITI